MGYNHPIEYDYGYGSTSVGTWLALPIGETDYKVRVDQHPERAQRITDIQRGVGDLSRSLGVLAKVTPREWVRRRRS